VTYVVQNKGAHLNTVDVFQVAAKSMVMIFPDTFGKITLGFLQRPLDETGTAMRSPLDVHIFYVITVQGLPPAKKTIRYVLFVLLVKEEYFPMKNTKSNMKREQQNLLTPVPENHSRRNEQ
jgi:hypothetical protein